MPPFDLFEAIDTLRAMRRLKPDPVPDELIQQVLEAATKAGSGGNRQPWAFLVIRDPELRQALGGYYRRAWEEIYGPMAASRAVDDRVFQSASHLAQHMGDAPVLILVCRQPYTVDPRLDVTSHGASIYPAVQNLMLAARALGLGTTLTTIAKLYDQDIKALLGIPAAVEIAALLPLGYPEGRFGPTRRKPVSEVAFADRWGQAFEAGRGLGGGGRVPTRRPPAR